MKKLQDPRYKYPTPPFPKPEPDHDGSQSKVKPPADHGEESYRGHDRLEGRVAFITGGDSGIGRAIAIAFAREGADVAIGYHSSDDDAKQTAEYVEKAGRRSHLVKFDQSEYESCRDAVESVVDKLGRLDILINNAAFQRTYDRISDAENEEIEYTFRTNIVGLFSLSSLALKHIKPGGVIINTTSIQAYSPSPYLAPYAATKAAIANFTKSLAEDAIQQGVRVNAVAPGPVWTPLIPETMPPEKVESFGKNTVFDRPAQPAELAPIYVFLASDEASYVTGEVYGATGARSQL